MPKFKTQTIQFLVKEFPAKTESIYLTGNCEALGNWDPAKAVRMQYYQKEEGQEYFFTEVEVPTGDMIEYKYINHRDWRSVECGRIANDIPNRTITVKNDSDYRTVEDIIRGFKIY